MKLQFGVSLMVSVTNICISVCICSKTAKSNAQEKPQFLPDWSIPSLCHKLKEDYKGDENFLVLVPIQGANAKPKIFRQGCFLLQSNQFDGLPNGMIDSNSRYFVPRTYNSIYKNKKMRCVPFIEEKMPENFNPFNETKVTSLEALQICKFFSQASHDTGEKRFVPKYMPLVLNVESNLRCIHWVFDYQEVETWARKTIPDCTQPVAAGKKPIVVKAMSEASCEFHGGEIVCKPVDTLQAKITRVNLLLANRKKELKNRKIEKNEETVRNMNSANSQENKDAIDKYLEKAEARKRNRNVQKVEKNAPKDNIIQSSTEAVFTRSCEKCKATKKTVANGNFKINKPSTNKSNYKTSKSSKDVLTGKERKRDTRKNSQNNSFRQYQHRNQKENKRLKNFK